MTRTIIAGSREGVSKEQVRSAIDSCPWEISVVISGNARGVDTLGEELAEQLQIVIDRYPANWDLYGKGAGMLRNSEMARNSEALILIWDGKSRGSKNMLETAKLHNLKIHEVLV